MSVLLCKISVFEGGNYGFFLFSAAVPLVSVLLCKINVFEGGNYGVFFMFFNFLRRCHW